MPSFLIHTQCSSSPINSCQHLTFVPGIRTTIKCGRPQQLFASLLGSTQSPTTSAEQRFSLSNIFIVQYSTMAPVSALHIQAGLEQSDTFPPMAITAVRKTVTLWQAPVFLWTLSAIFVALIVLSSIIAIRKLRRSNREEESESSCFPCLSSACSNPNCDSAPLYTPLRRMANITVALLRGELGSPLAYRHLPSALRFSFSRSSDSVSTKHCNFFTQNVQPPKAPILTRPCSMIS